MEPLRRPTRRGAMSRPIPAFALLALVLVATACSKAGGGVPSSSPEASSPASQAPTSTPGAFGTIDHATGGGDVLLRYEEGGGFVMPAWTAASAPVFTLYGDGTIIFRNPAQDPLPTVGSVAPFHPYRVARMDEGQIQALLEYALGTGGLGTARLDYPNNRVADASTATFTVNAGGVAKKVSVYALGIDSGQVADGPARQAFAKLRDRLADIDQGGTIKTDVYQPTRYRAILLEGQPGASDQRAWPWPAIKPGEFVSPGDPNSFPLPARLLTTADADKLGIHPFEGGFVGMPLAGPDKQSYSLSLRPLLPDEAM
jgi:hypothetical protein